MTINTSVQPYFDDFQQSNKFYKILFKPGIAVQARELTQLQTQLQNQISNFGDHIFKNGSVVLNGQTFFENNLKHLKIETAYDGAVVDVSTLIGLEVSSQISDTVAIVKDAVAFDGTNPSVLIVQIISGDGFVNGEVLDYTYNSQLKHVTLKNPSAVGNAMKFSIAEGVFYVDGKFVFIESQSIIVDAFFNTTSKNIGFVVNERIITSDEDETLLDNAQGSPNFAAPGADRYYIDLVLTVKGLNDTVDNFLELARVVDGQLVVNKNATVYSEIEKELARRTYDESGDYTVRNFPIIIKDHIATARVTANIVGGSVTSYNIEDAGRGFKSAPTLTVTGDGINATATVAIDTNPLSATYGQVTSVTPVSIGSGYTYADVDVTGDPTQFTIALDPGKAYVRGFELETINQTYLSADRALTSEIADNIDTSVSYGNFLYVNDIYNNLDTTAFTSVELHNVVRASVSGATTKVGSAKVRFLKWNSGTIGTSAAIYRLSLFDIVVDSGKLFKDVESVVVRSGATVLAGANIDLLSKVGGSAGGDVFLSGADTPSLVFPLNHEYVKTIRDGSNTVQSDYTFQRTFNSVAFSGGTASISTDNGLERFFGGSGAYSLATKDQYYHVVVTAVGTSGFSVGQVLRFDGSRTVTGSTIIPNTSHQVTFDVGAAVNFTATIIATVNANAVPERTKTLSGYTLKIISSPATAIGGKNSLETSDIYELVSVYNTSNTNPTGQVTINSTTGVLSWGTVTSQRDVSVDYQLDNGQRDEYYDHGNIVLTGTAPVGTDYLVAVYRYFSHTGNGYLSVDSYSISYDDIPSYISPATKKEYQLRDSLDFRPRRQDGGTSYLNARLPDSDFTFNSDYQYYLPRIDIVLATKDKQLIVKQGIPSLNPQVPADESDSMRLYVLSIPPYTNDLDKIAVKYIENKRYTMRDIGRLENRIENVEYYTQLSLLEKQAQDESITDASNLEKFKNGILVDPFVGHSVGDVTSVGYRCSVDPTKRELRPFYEIGNVDFSFGTFTSTTQTGPTVSLQYTETPIISQLLATKAININPFNVISYFGTITLEPSQDLWVDTVQLPPMNVTVDQNRAAPDVFRGVNNWWGWNNWGWNWNNSWAVNGWGWAGFGWGWNNWGWGSGWNGGWWGWRPTATNVSTQTTITESTQSLGNNVIDTQFLPFIRQKTIFGVGEGFKPKARVHPFIDETSIAQYCRPLKLITIQNLTGTVFNDRTGEYEALTFKTGGVGGATVATAKTALITPPTSADPTKRLLSVFDQVNVTGNIAVGQTVVSASGAYATVTAVTSYNLGDALYPDEFGLLAYEIQLPGGTFRTGERTVRLIDNIDNDTTVAESSGETKYFALGTSQTKQETLLTTRITTTQRVVTRRWVDPLAQSFLISEDAYPEGLHVSSVDIYFRTKSANVPVTLELRKMVNGYPESSQTIPFGIKTLYPESVTISETGVNATNFKFDVPVHLTPGEYCFVLLANTQEYEVFVAEMGKTLVNSNVKVSQQPYAGVLFKSQNASTWTAEQLEDMKFKLNRAVFNSSGSVQLVVNDITPVSITGNITTGNNTITSVVPANGTYVGIGIDMLVVGAGVPANTRITAVNPTTNVITLSNNATASTTGLSVSLYPVIDYSILNLNTSVVAPTNTSVTWAIKTLNRDTGLMDSTFSNFEIGKDFTFSGMKRILPKSQNGNVNSIILEATITSNKDTVSPVIDIGRTGMTLIKNVVNNDASTETNAIGGSALARYVTKSVTLNDEFDASNIVVTLDAYKPSGTDVKVYYKTLPSEKNTPIADEAWVEMELGKPVAFSTNENDYKEHKYYPVGAFNAYGVPVDNPISPRFNIFAIKIVMLSSNEAVVPKVRDFRTIALDS